MNRAEYKGRDPDCHVSVDSMAAKDALKTTAKKCFFRETGKHSDHKHSAYKHHCRISFKYHIGHGGGSILPRAQRALERRHGIRKMNL